MYPSEARDMAVSVVIYMIAIAFGLALFVVPIYLMSRPTVVANAGLPAAQSIDRTLAKNSGSDRFPVAHIKQETIVDPDTIAELNAKTKESESEDRVHYRSYARPAPTPSYTPRAVRPRPAYGSIANF
jgi:hypothetical protein